MSQAISPKKTRNRLSAADWEHQALEMIAEEGVRAFAVEPLARRMGITKGSFYWHFPNREALLDQALASWEKHDARNLNMSLGEIEDSTSRSFSRTSSMLDGRFDGSRFMHWRIR